MPQSCTDSISASEIAHVHCSGRTLEIDFSDGRSLFAPLMGFPLLATATQAQRDNWVLMDEGRSLGWPELGEHIALQDILGAARVVD